MTSNDDERELREQIRRLQAEHDRLQTEARELRRAMDLPALQTQVLSMAFIVALLVAAAAYLVYRLLFHWFD